MHPLLHLLLTLCFYWYKMLGFQAVTSQSVQYPGHEKQPLHVCREMPASVGQTIQQVLPTDSALPSTSAYIPCLTTCFLLTLLNLTTWVTVCTLFYLYDLQSASHSYLVKHLVSGKHRSVVYTSPIAICLMFHSHPQLHSKYSAEFKVQFYNKQKHYCYKYITLQPHYKFTKAMGYSRISNHYNKVISVRKCILWQHLPQRTHRGFGNKCPFCLPMTAANRMRKSIKGAEWVQSERSLKGVVKCIYRG